MLGNLTGWHILIVLGVLIVMAVVAVVVVVIVVVAIRLSRRKNRALSDPVEQIQKLAQLRDQGLLSDAEYEAKRQELMGRI